MNNIDHESRLKYLMSEMTDQHLVDLETSLEKEISFRKALENAIPSGICIFNDAGKQVYVNKSFCEMTGWDEDELLWKYPPFVYWDKEDIDNAASAWEQTINNKAPKEGFDLGFRNKAGKKFPVNVIIAPLKQENERTFFLANVIDISSRKRTEQELLQSKSLLIASIEGQKNSIIFFLDRNYNYLYFNKTHAHAMKYAYNADIETGMNMVDCMTTPNDKKAAKENIERALRGESFTYINTFGSVNRDYYEVLLNPIYGDNKEVIGCTGLARNITERMQAEQALKNSETKFKEIIDQINDIIIVFDEHRKVIIWNKGAENILGLKADDAINRSIVDIQHKFTPPPHNDRHLIENIIDGIVTLKTPEVFNHVIDSEIISPEYESPRNIQSTIFPVCLEGKYLFCTVIRDVTEMKRYEKELLRISTDKDKFYSTIAQYLHTPFNLFQNFASLMAEELDNLPIREIQKMAVMMSKSASNLYNLLDNLLQWTKMNQGKIAFEPQKLDFRKVCGDSVSILKPNAKAKNIKVTNRSEDNITVFADLFMIKTVLRNLISNAIKYSENGNEITILAEQASSEVTVSVSVNGTFDYPANIFTSSQIHAALDLAEEKGTTLGLLLAKDFVGKHGGKIWVASENGKSNEIRFTLPVN